MGDYPGMHSVYWHSAGGWMFLWWVLIILLTAGSAILFVRKGNSNQEKRAIDILKERYARGEIDKQEFEEKKRDILN